MVKKSPPVKEIIKDPVIIQGKQEGEIISPSPESQIPNPAPPTPTPVVSEEKENQAISEIEIKDEKLDFPAHWMKIADLFFDKMPAVYYSIKEHIPEIKDNIVLIGIKNPLQKELIESKKREILTYLREHFGNAIEEVKIIVDEDIETKAKLLNAQDRVSELAKQNEDLPEFLKILSLSVKE